MATERNTDFRVGQRDLKPRRRHAVLKLKHLFSYLYFQILLLRTQNLKKTTWFRSFQATRQIRT
jgi:hypothetical protein